LHIESALQRTGAKKLPSLLMGTVIVLAGAESAAQINARYGRSIRLVSKRSIESVVCVNRRYDLADRDQLAFQIVP
jgi:hypothetical protein